ncbi:unnamed protein product, partial [marine sediment metagenome]
QYVIGDSVKIGDIAGTIEDITLRVTSIRDIEGHLHFIPNGEVKTVSNRSRQWSRVILDVGVPYNEDLKKAFDLLNEIGKEISEDENYKNYIITPIRVLGQSVIKDVINGIFILFENQYVIGDSVKIGDIAGTIEDITLRVTSIRDIEGHLHFIPNGEVKTVSNRSRQWSRVILDVGVPYNEDLKKAFDLLNEIGKEISEDENYKNYIITPIRVLGITEFGESAAIIRVWGKVKPGKNFPINREFRKRLIEKAGQLKLKIPYPKKAIILKQE